MTGKKFSALGKNSSTSIAPWLTVRDGWKAVEFYTSAFGATEAYRMEAPDGSLIARLSIQGAEFWVSGDSNRKDAVGELPVRMILTVADPDAVFAVALKAGASQVYPVEEAHGWRLGRLIDPFGFHWEIGKPLGNVS